MTSRAMQARARKKDTEALLFSQLDIILVVIGLRMDVGLVLPSLGFSNVDVRKAELVL